MAYAPCEKLDELAAVVMVDEPRHAGSPIDQAETERPEVVERLERLDDVIFPAIDGDETALEVSAPVWRETVAELGPVVVEESRSEYLRYARSVWLFLTSQTVSQPLRLLAVMKIIGLLMGDDV